ncbi:hypothetical protein BJV74DRAFT_619949 [Russula compacta]|nr:hypothetical protein BJV74DRAFT_619949 [Russula compacta]
MPWTLATLISCRFILILHLTSHLRCVSYPDELRLHNTIQLLSHISFPINTSLSALISLASATGFVAPSNTKVQTVSYNDATRCEMQRQ